MQAFGTSTKNLADAVHFVAALLELPNLAVIALGTTAAVLFCQLLAIALVLAISPDDRRNPVEDFRS